MTQPTLSRIELGQPATIEQVWRLSKALDIAPRDLVSSIEMAVNALRALGVKVVARTENHTASTLGGAALGALLTLCVMSSLEDEE